MLINFTIYAFFDFSKSWVSYFLQISFILLNSYSISSTFVSNNSTYIFFLFLEFLADSLFLASLIYWGSLRDNCPICEFSSLEENSDSFSRPDILRWYFYWLLELCGDSDALGDALVSTNRLILLVYKLLA